MKALGTTSLGNLSSLSVIEVPEPVPRRGEVRVRVHATAVNPADIKIVRWSGPARFLHAKVSPLVPGYDLSGVVDAVGDGVTDLGMGDEVFGHLEYSGKNRQGAFAEWVTMDAMHLARKPTGVDHRQAAAAATVGLTALQALRDKASLESGARLLVIGAAGGVGSFAVQIGKRMGAHVTGVCSTYAVDFVRELGADVVIDRKKQDVFTGGDTFDVVFDTTGSQRYGECRRVLGSEGVFVTTLPSLSFVGGKLSSAFSSRR